MREQRKAMVLVLNKCDLVPTAAVEEWSHFFHTRYPGLRVVAVAANSGYESASAILEVSQ